MPRWITTTHGIRVSKNATMLVVRPFVSGIPISSIFSASQCGCLRHHSHGGGGVVSSFSSFSSLPHHLAQKNNGMVNVLVKSTKVPRPPATYYDPVLFINNNKTNSNKLVVRNHPFKQQHGKLNTNTNAATSSVYENLVVAAVNKKLLVRTDNNDTEPMNMKTKKKKNEESRSFSYAGNVNIPITSKLKIVLPGEDVPHGIWPAFRMMGEEGNIVPMDDHIIIDNTNPITSIVPEKYDLSQLQSILTIHYPHFAKEIQTSHLFTPSRYEYSDTRSTNTLLRAHRQMIRLRKMDTILHNAQRQGRISFYMTHHGEEAIHMGSASALKPQDHIFAQYREAGLLMWRGFTLEQFCNQCFSNDLDLGKGRQMPIHYGSRALNYQTISSPLGTQITQAVGAAYKFKLDSLIRNNPGKRRKMKEEGEDDDEAAISIVYFGDGAASTVDFHSGCNFAATLRTPMIFFCRNNGYAISTPVEDQYAGDGIVSRAPGYGMAGIRVDGNDIFAVHAAVAEARRVALETSAPVMIEAMTYRQGHHSTSDDSSRYRDSGEVQKATIQSDPILRLDRFLKQYGWMNDTDSAAVEDEERVAVLRAMEMAEARQKPKIDTMFTDVYHTMPRHLIRQEKALKRHLKKHSIPFH